MKKFSSIFLGSPIPIPNFPKIPKIALRKSCEEPKHAKTPRERRGLIMLRPGHPGRTFTNVVKKHSEVGKIPGNSVWTLWRDS